MTELELWQRIVANAYKVPNLELRDHQNSVIEFVIPRGNFDSHIVGASSRPDWHRYVAMLVVDAIEAAGLASFDRYAMPIHGDVGYMSRPQDIAEAEPFAINQTARENEHLALLECLALTLEALPEQEKTQ